jgi:hypothetical protein
MSVRQKVIIPANEYDHLSYIADVVEGISIPRLAEIAQAERDGRLVVLQKTEPFDCKHCKHLRPSDKTKRLFCSYHSEGGNDYETYADDYCSYFERAESALEKMKGANDGHD